MVTKLNIAQYFEQKAGSLPLIDVRSPGEFAKGHVPGAHNIPLFNDAERAEVGTMYVRHSREKAIELGYKFVTPKLRDFIEQATLIAPDRQVVVHCWRGGMRSAAFAQHLSDNGFQTVFLIEGGYKAFRNHVLKTFDFPFKLRILGGYTGSGKTHILQALKQRGHQVVDLEHLANHKGSAFGGIGLPEQPTVEQFENMLFDEFRRLDFSRPIWLEDESHNIGAVKIPMNLFTQMRQQKLYFVNIPAEKRAAHLVKEYGNCLSEELAYSIQRISKRLGGLAVKNALHYLADGNYFEVAKIALFYYDKSYLIGMNSRDQSNVDTLELKDTNARENAEIILNYLESYV
ncbi:tRNA 2-selenouridine(34) synthase MnmH [Mangrovibacterium sp.]|uniref:tRNA 2-selenouridine(34) synthase MnmH n=1 Tax=Mangrovibacterium sp. TaxID=1961364 RepID=UPI0035620797